MVIRHGLPPPLPPQLFQTGDMEPSLLLLLLLLMLLSLRQKLLDPNLAERSYPNERTWSPKKKTRAGLPNASPAFCSYSFSLQIPYLVPFHAIILLSYWRLWMSQTAGTRTSLPLPS